MPAIAASSKSSRATSKSSTSTSKEQKRSSKVRDVDDARHKDRMRKRRDDGGATTAKHKDPSTSSIRGRKGKTMASSELKHGLEHAMQLAQRNQREPVLQERRRRNRSPLSSNEPSEDDSARPPQRRHTVTQSRTVTSFAASTHLEDDSEGSEDDEEDGSEDSQDSDLEAWEWNRARRGAVELAVARGGLVTKRLPLRKHNGRSKLRISLPNYKTLAGIPDPLPETEPWSSKSSASHAGRWLSSDFTTPSRQVLEHGQECLRVHAVTVNMYPTPNQATNLLYPLVARQLQMGLAGQEDRIGRLTDDNYMEVLCKMPFHDLSSLRHHLLESAIRVAQAHWFPTGTARNTVKEEVRQLTTQNLFIYSNRDDRDGMFEHPAIADVISDAWFTTTSKIFRLGRSAPHTAVFRNYPMPMIAAACIALRCALDRHTSGSRTSSHPFSARTYEPMYRTFLEDLATLTQGDAGVAYSALCAEWYERACGAINTPLPEAEEPAKTESEDMRRNRERLAERARVILAERARRDAAVAAPTFDISTPSTSSDAASGAATGTSDETAMSSSATPEGSEPVVHTGTDSATAGVGVA